MIAQALTPEDLIQRFLGSDTARQLQAERAAEVQQQRRAAVETLASIEAERQHALPPLLADKARADHEVEQLEQALTRAKQAAVAAERAVTETETTFDAKRRRHERTLATTAPEELTDFIAQLSQRLEDERNQPVPLFPWNQRPHTRERWLWERDGTHPIVDAWEARLRRVDALRHAIGQARALEHQAVDDLPRALAAIEATIP